MKIAWLILLSALPIFGRMLSKQTKYCPFRKDWTRGKEQKNQSEDSGKRVITLLVHSRNFFGVTQKKNYLPRDKAGLRGYRNDRKSTPSINGQGNYSFSLLDMFRFSGFSVRHDGKVMNAVYKAFFKAVIILAAIIGYIQRCQRIIAQYNERHIIR